MSRKRQLSSVVSVEWMPFRGDYGVIELTSHKRAGIHKVTMKLETFDALLKFVEEEVMKK